MSKHTAADLKQMQSLPLEAKIAMTQRRIRDWYDHWNGDVYVSFSGGKDSTVLKHIVDGMYNDIPAVFVNTGLEYPEIQQFVREIKAGKYDCFNSDVEIVRPEMRFDEVIQKYGYPVISKEVSNTIAGARNSIEKGKYSLRLCKLGVRRCEYGGLYDDGKHDYEVTLKDSKFTKEKWRFLLDADFKISSRCCDVMKKRPASLYEKKTGRKPLIATMAYESMNRETAWFKNGCNAFKAKKPQSTPMAFWTEQDVLRYIKRFNVPYCPVYGDIVYVPKYKKSDVIAGQISFEEYCQALCNLEQNTLKTTGCDRTGCVFCLFGCHLEAKPNRIQRLKQTHPKQWAYCVGGGEMMDGIWQPSKDGLGLGKVMDFIGIPYE